MSNKQRQRVINNLADWLDTQTIAEAIVQAVEDYGATPTFGDCQCVWSDFLEHELSHGLMQSTRATLAN